MVSEAQEQVRALNAVLRGNLRTFPFTLLYDRPHPKPETMDGVYL